MRRWPGSLVAAVLLTLAGCGGDGGGVARTSAPEPIPADPLVQARPYGISVPPGYDGDTPTPLVLLAHGYGASGYTQAVYWGLFEASSRDGFLLARPDGRSDSHGRNFWNATDACCDRDGNRGDDVAYLMAVIDDVQKRYNVDAKRIYVVGHSNGGFMSHRLACEHGDRIAAIVSLAGMTWSDPDDCPAPSHVSVLQVHGDADRVVRYAGGGPLLDGLATYPSATATVAAWAARNNCSGALGPTGDARNLDVRIAGAETRIEAYRGCPADGAVELWTIEGGGHVPRFGDQWSKSVWAWLAAHPKA